MLLEPRFITHENIYGTFSVRLKLPDGSERVAKAQLETSHMRGQNGVFALIRLPELGPEDVPAGTEVWRAETA